MRKITAFCGNISLHLGMWAELCSSCNPVTMRFQWQWQWQQKHVDGGSFCNHN